MATRSNFKKVRSNFSRLKETYPAAYRQILKEFGGIAVDIGKTQGIIPRRTGDLASTARVEVRDGKVYIVTGGINGEVTGQLVDYAIFVNNGTSRQRAQFFMERMISASLTEGDKVAEDALKTWLNSV